MKNLWGFHEKRWKWRQTNSTAACGTLCLNKHCYFFHFWLVNCYFCRLIWSTVQSPHFSGGIEDNHNSLQSGYLIFSSKICSCSLIQSRIADYLVTLHHSFASCTYSKLICLKLRNWQVVADWRIQDIPKWVLANSYSETSAFNNITSFSF
jgi:hypothetical protein